MARSRVKTEYRKAISILKDYFFKSKANPLKTVLEQAIDDRVEELETPYKVRDINAGIKSGNAVKTSQAEQVAINKATDKRLKRLTKRQQIIVETIRDTPSDLLKVIKEVYIFERWNIERDAVGFLFMNKEQIYKQVREWFNEFEERFYF